MSEETLQVTQSVQAAAEKTDDTPKTDGISIAVDSVAGPISIVRVTQSGAFLMQHC